MNNFRERLSANAEDFDSIVSDILNRNEELEKEVERLANELWIARKSSGLLTLSKEDQHT